MKPEIIKRTNRCTDPYEQITLSLMELQSLLDKIEQLERQLKEAQKIINTLDKQLSEVKAENTRLNDEYNRYIKNSDEIINNAGDKLRELYAENARLTKELAEAKAELMVDNFQCEKCGGYSNYRWKAHGSETWLCPGCAVKYFEDWVVHLREGLKKLEWTPCEDYCENDTHDLAPNDPDSDDEHHRSCMGCGAMQCEGHKPDCWFASTAGGERMNDHVWIVEGSIGAGEKWLRKFWCYPTREEADIEVARQKKMNPSCLYRRRKYVAVEGK